MNRTYLKYDTSLLILLSLLVILLVSGCVSPNPIQSDILTPSIVEKKGKIPYSVNLDVYGGHNPNCYNFCLTGDAYAEAVKSTLVKSEAFSSITSSKDADYILDIIIVDSGGVMGSTSTESIMISKWELTKAEPTRVVWSEIIKTRYSSDSWTDPLKKANEAAARINIIDGVYKLTSLHIEDSQIEYSINADLKHGLVAHYPFNGNANDESAHGLDGKVFGAALTADRLGDADSAYSFDGNNDAIHIAHNKDLNFQNSFSLSVWFYSDNNGSRHQRLIGKGTAPRGQSSSWSLTVKDDGKVAFFWESPDDADHIVVTKNSLESSGFNHIVAIYDSTLNANKIYVNGTFSNATWALSGYPGQNRDPLILGMRNTPERYDRAFFGTMDDVRIYNRVLSEREIQELYSGDISE